MNQFHPIDRLAHARLPARFATSSCAGLKNSGIFELFKMRGFVRPQGYSVLDEYRLLNDNDPTYSKARLMHRQGQIKDFSTFGLSRSQQWELTRLLFKRKEELDDVTVFLQRLPGDQFLGVLAHDVRVPELAQPFGNEALHAPLPRPDRRPARHVVAGVREVRAIRQLRPAADRLAQRQRRPGSAQHAGSRSRPGDRRRAKDRD